MEIITSAFRTPFFRNNLLYFLLEIDTRKQQACKYIDKLIKYICRRDLITVSVEWNKIGYDTRGIRVLQHNFCQNWGLINSSYDCTGLIAPNDELIAFTHAYEFCEIDGGVREFCHIFGVLYFEFIYYVTHGAENKYNAPNFTTLNWIEIESMNSNFMNKRNEIKIVDLFDCIIHYRKRKSQRNFSFCNIDLHDF